MNREPTPTDAGEPAAVDQVTVERAVPGGVMLSRADDGRIVLVVGAIPGERVEIAPVTGSGRVARGRTIGVVGVVSPDRLEPPCPHVADGCGGCDWMHIAPARQTLLKREIVIDALGRIARLHDPDVTVGRTLPSERYRTSVRVATDGTGRAGYRASRSHRIVPVDSCRVAHPRIEAVLAEGRFAPGIELAVRTSVSSGETVVAVDKPSHVISVPDGATVVARSEGSAGRGTIREQVGGVGLSVSAASFFQGRPDGATSLVDTVRVLLDDVLEPTTRLVDLYCGVGMFGAALAASVGSVVGVEWSRSSVADAERNLASVVGTVTRCDVNRWRPEPADVVVADPARDGLGPKAVDVIRRTGCRALALVSCDAGALGRDARLLEDAGFSYDRSVVVDLFPQTHHVEVVTRFTRR